MRQNHAPLRNGARFRSALSADAPLAARSGRAAAACPTGRERGGKRCSI